MKAIISRKFQTLKSEWNERQRRLWAASEAMCLGRGGVSTVARATGLSRPTISKGIKELKNGERLAEKRVRREGAGRKKVTETQPGLLSTLDAIVEPTAKGNPMSPLRWTTKSTRRLCETLNEQGFGVSHMQVCHLLHDLEYQLAGNRKSLEGGTNPDRNTPFEFINEQAAKFLKRNIPAPNRAVLLIISDQFLLLFNHISMNWKGQPLVSMDVIINLIGNTTSQTGLKV